MAGHSNVSCLLSHPNSTAGCWTEPNRSKNQKVEPHQNGRIRPADESLFVNDAVSPTLEVGRLEGDSMKGSLRLQGPATLSNMVITPDAVDGLSPEPARDPLDGDRGLVRKWRLSTFSALPNAQEPTYSEMPGASQQWKSINTERNGLANLSRVYGRPLREPNRAVARLKAMITSDRKQTKKVDIGWTRQLWVFVNGKLV